MLGTLKVPLMPVKGPPRSTYPAQFELTYVGTDVSETVMDSAAVAVRPCESVTSAVKLHCPAEVGVPTTVPEAERTRLGGSEPEASDHV
jgi:hypothetical protein